MSLASQDLPAHLVYNGWMSGIVDNAYSDEFLSLDRLSEESKRRVLGDHCARYYKLG